ncbi:mRNA cap guanine-N7 methyltransferase [Meloidogyne graminicola]|uniref:mRNA (guanine-N(7))-methyltransferase n=1 Tax=Meloidogyne graminicola TaxID=189291 RepID=A0A8T0A2W5_9BILA|nr:mRNA cap guanine-N7 methyltransferase [Meloidogyne graminicola]
MNFISEKELIKKREENADEEGNSEQTADYRPLYERLKEVRDKKQLEWEEEHTLKNQFSITRGIDEGDADFFEQIDRAKEEQEARKRKEEMELVKMAKQQSSIISLEQQPSLLERPQKPSTINKNSAKKQANLLSSLIRKRSHSRTSVEDGTSNDKAKKSSFISASDDSSQGSASTTASFEEPKKKEEDSKSSLTPKGLISSVLDYSDTSGEENELERNNESINIKQMTDLTKLINNKNSTENTKDLNLPSSSLVASHYNAIPEIGIKKRNDSCILHLRNMNNWMKSMLIVDFIQATFPTDTIDRLKTQKEGNFQQIRVLDLACGKGGDLRKWRVGAIDEIVMTDIADISLQDCRDRFYRMRDRRTKCLPFRAHFIQADLTQVNLSNILPNEAPKQFEVASCQFALHYAFRSEECARQMLENCTKMLQPGGYFIGTITNASAIMQYLRKSSGHFSNRVCSVTLGNNLSLDEKSPLPLFGAEIRFRLEGVVDCPEYLCYFPLLQRMLEEMGFQLIFEFDFPDAIDYYLKERGNEAIDLMQKMDALETLDKNKFSEIDEDEFGPAILKLKNENTERIGTISKSEWEVITMYKAFAFQKRISSEALDNE